MLSNFWWKHDNDKRGIHWISWAKMCKPTNVGGMGFRDMECFNKAFLGKQCWRLVKNMDRLAYRVLNAKYFPRISLMNARLGYNPSLVWRSIWEARNVLQQGLRWRFGNGQSIRIWEGKWLSFLTQLLLFYVQWVNGI